MNLCVMIGNLVDEPKLIRTQSGISKCSFRIGVAREYATQDGKRESDFFNVVTWRGSADNCAKYLHKGSKCAVRGSMQNRTYEAQDGSKRYITELVAERVQFFLAPKAGNGNTRGESETYGAPPDGFTEVDDDELPF